MTSTRGGSPRIELRLVLIVAALCLGTGLTGVALRNVPESHRLITVDALYPSFSLKDIVDRSHAVAILEFEETAGVFWNSADNQEWVPEIASGKQAWIFRDDRFRVIEVLRGTLPSEQMTIRGVGGTVGGVTVELRDQTDWVRGNRYLLFLRQDQTPMEIGSELAWTVVWGGHGSLNALGNDQWANELATLSVSGKDVRTLP